MHSQRSPMIGGPWHQNAYSGIDPPWGVEWDAPLPGVGIMPGEMGAFSFCTLERMDVVVEEAGSGQGPAGWAHTWGTCVGEPIVDADGTSSADWGTDADVDVVCGDPLASWPTGGDAEGIDWFDNDGDCLWSAGDDIHVEGAAFPGANRDGWHDDNANGDGFWNDGEDIVMDANGDWIFD